MKTVVEVIVLELKNYSESSLWVCFFSKENGVQNGIIKGGKKKRTKPSILGFYNFTIYRHSESGLQTVVNLERTIPLDEIYCSPQKVLIAFFMSDSYKSILVNCGTDSTFFDFIKTQVLKLKQVDKTGPFPVVFLAELISYLGYPPLNPSGSVESFDPLNGVFNPNSPSLQTIHEKVVVEEIHFIFNEQERVLLNPKKVFDALINYAIQHVPGYNRNKSIEVIKDVLYG